MKVIIVRHAQTNENTSGIITGGESQSLLNEMGIMQAQKLADFLRNEVIDVAYASPQHRALRTAKEALKFHPSVTIIEISDLREQHMGIYENRSKQEVREMRKQSKEPFHLFKPEKGESYVELQERVANFFNGLLKKHQNNTVFIVSHGGTLSMLYLHLLGKEITEENYKAHKPENTAVTIIKIEQDKPMVVHKLNSVEHLN